MQLTRNIMVGAMGQPYLTMEMDEGSFRASPIREVQPDHDPVTFRRTGDGAQGVCASDASRYADKRGVNWPVFGLSVSLVGGLMVAFIMAGVIHVRKLEETQIVVQMLSEAKPPAPPEPENKPVETIKAPTPIVAPPPLVTLPAPPSPVMTSPVASPPVQAVAAAVSTPGPAAPQAAPPSIETVGDMSSNMVEVVSPSYPVESRRRKEQGVVMLMVLLGLDGRVADINVSRSSGFPRLDNAALSAVKRWRWSPTRRGGRPVMVRGVVEIPFILRGVDRGGHGGRDDHGRGRRDDEPTGSGSTITAARGVAPDRTDGSSI